MEYIDIIKEILNKENISYKNINKVNSGFTNLVFSIDNKLIIKINNKDTIKLEKEISIYKNITLPFMPKYYCDGNYDNFKYLIIEKLEGVPLYFIWHTFDNAQKKDIIHQICDILKEFHSVKKIGFLNNKFIYNNWIKHFEDSFYYIINKLSNLGIETSFIQSFKPKLTKYLSEQNSAIIYNDAHFDNFIYNNGKISLIDFDRVIYAPIDYELLIPLLMTEKPNKFANEECEKFCKISDYSSVVKWIHEYYPDLFNFEFLSERLFIYKFIYNLNNAIKFNHIDIVTAEIEKFKSYFNIN